MANQTEEKFKLLELSYQFYLSRCIHVAAQLGIADVLQSGPQSAAEIAAKLNTHPDYTERLMRFLVLYDIFGCNGQHKYYNNALSELFRSDSTDSMRDVLMLEDETRWNSYGALLYSLKTGKPAFDKLYGASVFEYVAGNPALSARLSRGLRNWDLGEEQALAEAYNYSQFKTIADIGGNTGGMLAAILERNPTCRGILFDQPSMVEQDSLVINKIAENRRKMVRGDFFQSVPKGADLYILKRVLHDWPDEKCEVILTNIHKVLPSDGRVLVMEAVIDSEYPNKIAYNLDIMVMCLLEGRERTKAEFSKIYQASGFVINRIIQTSCVSAITELKKSGSL